MQRSMTVREKARHVVGAMMVSRVEENQLVKGNDFASQPSNWFQPLEVMLPRRVECSERSQLSLKKKQTNTNYKHKHKLQTQLQKQRSIHYAKIQLQTALDS